MLVILRPGLEGFTALSLLAVLGTLGFAGRDLATRAAPPVLSNLQLGIYGFAMMVPTGASPACRLGRRGRALWHRRGCSLRPRPWSGVAAYYSLTVAMRTGEVSVVTPFRYTRLVFALILGVLVFGERPDALTLLGSVIIVASGLYTLLRARRVTVLGRADIRH